MFFSDGGWRAGTFPHTNDYAEQSFFGRTDAAWAHPSHRNPNQLGDAGFPVSRGINVASLDGHVYWMQWRGEKNPIAVRISREYELSHKPFWGRPGSQSWNLALHPD
jgi:hypothetical protein